MARQKKERTQVQKCYKMKPETPDRLNALALSLGFIHGKYKETGEKIPAIGEMLDAIGDGRIILTVVRK